ncbi:MAG: hypothetical protein QOE36_2459 [Gaiellaceae bacterium]|jgi:photosystem II stability/assembly factor-like uncharacterized protein|nr:hypothetical protein [Gaiellaceae bacterium]
MRTALAAALALALAGCSQGHAERFGDLRVTSTVDSTWRSTPPSASHGPSPQIQNVTFLSRTHGFLVSSASRGFEAHRIGSGRIQETRDGGKTWRTRWSLARTELGWIGFADARHGFAAGWRQRGRLRSLLLRTSDGGRTWRAVHPRLPGRARAQWPGFVFTFPTASVGYALPDPDFGWFGPRWVLKTSDGGRSWKQLPAPAGEAAGSLDALDAQNVVVTASSERCPGSVWRSRDGGTSWQRVPKTCERGYELTAVDFRDRSHGLLVGGHPYYLETPPALVVRRTDDGGVTWRTIFVDRRRPRDKPFVRLRVVDALHAWAASGGCKMGQNSPCGGVVWTTSDGGRSWRETGQDAVQLAAAGPRSAWVVPQCEDDCAVLWRTRDAGTGWAPLADARSPGLRSVAAAGRRLIVDSAAGWFARAPRGRWRRLTLPAELDSDTANVTPAVIAYRTYQGVLRISADEGRTWRRARLPFAAPDLIAFADPQHGLLATSRVDEPGRVEWTEDGGRSWRLLDPPIRQYTLSAAPGLLAASPLFRPRFALSEDGGRTWRTLAGPSGWDCTATAGRHRRVWAVCTRGSDRVVSRQFFSRDGGRTWASFRAPRWAAGTIVLGDGELWTIVHDSLWRSRDGARSWVQEWPALPTHG